MIKTPPISFIKDNFCAVVKASDPQATNIKTETRRLFTIPRLSQAEVNQLKSIYQDGGGNWIGWSDDSPSHAKFTKEVYPNGEGIKSRYQIGDRCYLTEPTQIDTIFAHVSDTDHFWHTAGKVSHKITENDLIKIKSRKGGMYKKTIARFMLKSFARYWVEITDVKVERLNDITDEGAIAEGIKCHVNRGYLNGNLDYEYPLYWDYVTKDYSFKSPITSYLSEIAAIHKPSKDKIGGYDLVDSNPWIWVYKFKFLEDVS